MRRLWKSIHQSWLIVALCAGILAGVVMALIFRTNFFVSWVWIILVLILFGFAFVKPNYFFVVVIFFAGIILAFVRTSADLRGEESIKNLVGETVEISGKISEDPDFDDDKISLRLSNLTINNVDIAGTIFVRLDSQNTNLQRSDRLKLQGKISEGFGNFSGSMYSPTILEFSRPDPGDLFLKLRNWFAAEVKKYIPDKEAKLGLAYLLGMKNGLDNELLELLGVVGLTHIVVASGTHLGIIIGSGKRIFGKISRFAGLLFSLLLIVVFGSIVGWTASITRAAIVAVFSLSAWYIGRKFESWRILLLAAAITLLINPMYLINLGWLLSFGSFAGIMLLSPLLTQFLYGDKKPKKISEIVVATISANLMCVPILIYYFGSISLISPLANLLILPTIPFTMGLTFLTGVTGFLPFLATILGKLTQWMLDYHLFIINFLGEQKMFLVNIGKANPWIFLLYIPIMIPFIIMAIKNAQKQKQLREKAAENFQ